MRRKQAEDRLVDAKGPTILDRATNVITLGKLMFSRDDNKTNGKPGLSVLSSVSTECLPR